MMRRQLRRLDRPFGVFGVAALLAAVSLVAVPALASERGPGETSSAGEVRVPLDQYEDLVDRARVAHQRPRPAPTRYALGRATVSVDVRESEGRVSAGVNIAVGVRTLEDGWTSVAVLPTGTAVSQATVDGRDVALFHSVDGLAWSTDKAGAYNLTLAYEVDAERSEGGYVLALPMIPGAAASLTANLPMVGVEATVVPAVNARSQRSGNQTRVTASIPPTSAVQLAWTAPVRDGWVMSRATYVGALERDAVVWTAEFDVELFTGKAMKLPLLPRSVTLRDLRIDDVSSTVLVEGGSFAASVEGRGAHTVAVDFVVPVVLGQGPPQVNLQVPEVPVSRLELVLPGEKEVTVRPASSVTTVKKDGSTRATVFVPMTTSVQLAWSEAIPEDLQTEVRANASLYHAAHAEEGVLHVRAMNVYEITHGETNLLEFEVPTGVQINRIVSNKGAVSDWRITGMEQDKPSLVSVFLDRKVTGDFPFDVYYERLLGAATEAIEVPLLRAVNVHRQRGMIALLSGAELALNPETEERVSKVGENQLPAFVRDALKMTVALTYKYTDADPKLTVRAVAPERKHGKFDAQVDTLVSIGEVTLRGSATVEINVKSGSLMDLQLVLPEDVNVLGLTAPSMRKSHEITPEDGLQRIDVAFTQEMEGQFRLEVNYERIMSDGAAEVPVPTVAVMGAEVENGRIAIEALIAVEVQAGTVEQLSTVDINELPQQLVLKTTNPILRAYKYSQREPPFTLTLRITHHREIDVQVAAIDSASYTTLVTRDGLAVTRATYMVRNSGRQFLEIELPPQSESWSVFVAGKAEKPAQAEAVEGREGDGILIKMINSADGFPVEIVYATKLDKMGALGALRSRLPRPDMVVQETRWSLFLPATEDLRYEAPVTNMDVLAQGIMTTRDAMQQSVAERAVDSTTMVQPLKLTVPERGLRYTFEKLYANQGDEHAEVEIPYSSATGARLARTATIIGALLMVAGIVTAVAPSLIGSVASVGLVALGALLMGIASVMFATSPRSALVVGVLALVLGLAVRLRHRFPRRPKPVAVAPPSPSPPDDDAS